MLASELLEKTLQGDRQAARELGRRLTALDGPSASGLRPQLAAYTANYQADVYTATPAALGQAAMLADLNELRQAYENLRAMTENLRTQLIAAKVLRD